MYIIKPITAQQIRDYSPPVGNLTPHDLADTFNAQWAGVGVTQENGNNVFHPPVTK